MASPKRAVVALTAPPADPGGAPRPGAVVGRVTGTAPNGRPLVDFPGNPAGPRTARTVLRAPHDTPVGSAVLLVFENADPRFPIILGTADDAGTDGRARDEHVVRGRRLELEARHEIVLRAGAGSLTIRADGTIVLRGTDVLTRSSGPNRIKGATVKIN